MKKILLIGSSVFNPTYFNTRLLGNEELHDEFSFEKILTKIYNVEVTSLAINGAGNDWPLNAVVTNQHLVDKDTMVIIMWSSVDRYDMHFGNNISNETISFPRKEMLPDHAKNELSLFRTYGLNGTVKDSGLRFYATGSVYPGIKREYKKVSYNEAVHLKQIYQNIALVQKLLEGACYKQIHFFPWDIEKYSEYELIGYGGWFSTIGSDRSYQWVELPDPHFDLIAQHPELQSWKNLVNWNLFSENYCEFFIKNKLPWWGGMNEHNVHQVPINNYKFICSEFLPDPGNNEHYFIEATKKHCSDFNIQYNV